MKRPHAAEPTTWALPLLIAMVFALWTPATAGATRRLVFVSVPPQAYLVKQLAGPLADVRTLVGPGRNPATYEPTPRQMADIAKADLFFSVGVPFEKVWMPRIREMHPTLPVVTMHKGITLRVTPAPGHAGDTDPHVWTSPQNAMMMATTAYAALVKADPGNERLYTRNLESLLRTLRELDRRIRGTLKELTTRRFLVFHPAWGYFAATYGLKQVPIEVGGREAEARALVALIEKARREGVRSIFVQRQFSHRQAEAVAREIGADLVVVDPLSEDYESSLLDMARALREALR